MVGSADLGRARACAYARAVFARYDTVTGQNIVLGLVSSLALWHLVKVPDAFLSSRLVLVRIVMVCLLGMVVSCLFRPRATSIRIVTHVSVVLVLVTMLGIASRNVAVLCCLAAVGTTTLVTVASHLGWRWLMGATVVNAMGFGVVLWQQGMNGFGYAQLTLIDFALVCLMAGPACVVFVLRQSLDKAIHVAKAAAGIDELTKLNNRRGLSEQLPRLASEAVREQGLIGVLLADLDHFKLVNDTLGHAVGDQVLQAVAMALSSIIRPTDLLVRLGGEELCLLAVIGDSTELPLMAERVRRAVAMADGPCAVTVSVGGAWGRPTRGVSSEALVYALIDQADRLLYEAKRAGRNVVRLPAA